MDSPASSISDWKAHIYIYTATFYWLTFFLKKEILCKLGGKKSFCSMSSPSDQRTKSFFLFRTKKKKQPLSINENSNFENFGRELHAKKSTCSSDSAGDVSELVAYPISCFPEDLSCLRPPRQTRLFTLKCQQLFRVCFR